MTDYVQYIAKTSRSRKQEKVPIDRLYLEICWWTVKELVFGRKKQVDEDAFVIESADLSHIRFYMAAAVHDLRRGADGAIVDGMIRKHKALYAGTD